MCFLGATQTRWGAAENFSEMLFCLLKCIFLWSSHFEWVSDCKDHFSVWMFRNYFISRPAKPVSFLRIFPLVRFEENNTEGLTAECPNQVSLQELINGPELSGQMWPLDRLRSKVNLLRITLTLPTPNPTPSALDCCFNSLFSFFFALTFTLTSFFGYLTISVQAKGHCKMHREQYYINTSRHRKWTQEISQKSLHITWILQKILHWGVKFSCSHCHYYDMHMLLGHTYFKYSKSHKLYSYSILILKEY